MNFEVAKSRYPIVSSHFGAYINRAMLPILDINKLDALCVVGTDRKSLKTTTTGVMSLILRYKQKEGAVSSFDNVKDDLVLLQLQGARSSVSFRVSRGFYWTDFMADEAIAIASHRDSGIRRLAMPKIESIEGIDHGQSEQLINRYRDFATRAQLRWSRTDDAYVRDVRR